MKYWPLKKFNKSRKPTYLLLSERGLGVLRVNKKKLNEKMQLEDWGKVPDGAELIANHKLLRIRSCRGTRTLVARMQGNRRRKFRLRSVAARDQLMESLKKHPSVTHANAGGKSSKMMHKSTRLGIKLLATVFCLLGLKAITNGDGAERLVNQLSLVELADVQLPALIFFAGLATLTLARYAWRSGRKPEVDEVLFE